jgi:hypothetical protein
MSDNSDGMIDAKVALATTEHVLITEGGDNEMEINLILQNTPVLVSETDMYFPEITPDLMSRIHHSLTTGMDVVDINSNLMSVFIGIDPEVEETGMVMYQEFSDNPTIKAFFQRWDETHTLIFEFTLNRVSATRENLGVLACVKGVRVGDKWVRLGIVKEPTIHIKEEE